MAAHREKIFHQRTSGPDVPYNSRTSGWKREKPPAARKRLAHRVVDSTLGGVRETPIVHRTSEGVHTIRLCRRDGGNIYAPRVVMPFPALPLDQAACTRRFAPLLEALEPRRLMSVTVFEDSFESPALTGWALKTYAGGSASPKWGVNSRKSYGGARSAFVAGPDRNTYASDQHTGMIRRDVSLAGFGSASLTFKYFLNTEAGYDFFNVNVLGPDGRATSIFRDSGDDRDAGWRSKTISLNAFAGKSGLGIEFRFDSDGSLVNEAPSGVWIDNVRLMAGTRAATATIRGSVFDDADGDQTRDPSEKALPGWIVYLDQNQNRRRDSGEAWRLTDAAGRYAFDGLAPGTYYVAEELRAGYAQTAPRRASVSSAGGFGIDVRFSDSSLTSSQRSAFSAAARRWARILVGDLPDVTEGRTIIDDLWIDASSRDIDGPGGVLAQASPSGFREGSGPGGKLPYRGFVEIDTADLGSLQSSGQLLGVLTHEMAHVLGFGTMWEQTGLLRGSGSSNPRFIGPVATAQFNAIFGRNDSGVPIENSGAPGTRDTHWRESVLGSELLTGFIDAGVNAISRITVGALADLGYVVDLGAADSFTPAGRSAQAPPAGAVHVVTVGAGQMRGSFDFGNRANNSAPKVSSVSAGDGLVAGSSVTLTAGGVSDPDGTITKVGFYREANGIAGLQVGAGGDTLVGTDGDKTGGYALTLTTAGLASGSHTYYALATDNLGAVSALGTAAPKTTLAVRAPGTISGTVFRDSDNDGIFDVGEGGIAGVKVYLDLNGNDRLDAGEPTSTTGSTGRYSLSGLTAGDYAVRIIPPAGLARTLPSSGRHVVKLGAGKTAAGKYFGLIAATQITGRVFHDVDADGAKDSNELGAAGFRVYLDGNNNGKLDRGETSILTKSTGTFSFSSLRPGTHVVRYASPAGWRLSTAYSDYSLTLGAGQKRSAINFGFKRTA